MKELIWATGGANSSGLMSLKAPVDHTVKLQLNGHDRFSEQAQEYFGLRQPFDYHSAVPGPNLPQRAEGVYYSTSAPTRTGNVVSGCAACVYVYSFALKPEEHQPSGTCNFSRIDNAKSL